MKNSNTSEVLRTAVGMLGKASISILILAFLLCAPRMWGQFIWVGNAGEDTVSKIDINANTEVARYHTWFTSPTPPSHLYNPWAGAAPSRIVQDAAGNIYVLNRMFPQNSYPPTTGNYHLPVLVKIAPTGGTPGIDTSNGSTPLPINDANANNKIDPGEAQDVRILWAKEIGTPSNPPPTAPADTDEGALGRALGIDPNGFLWVGMFTTGQYYKVNSTTGAVVAGPIKTPGHKPYGCQIDSNGKLWSVTEDDYIPNTLVEIDTTTNQVTSYNVGGPKITYSLSIFDGCGSKPEKIYLSDRSSSSQAYRLFDPATSSFLPTPLATTVMPFDSVSVGVDSNGDIVSGEHFSGRVIKSHPDGTVVWRTDVLPAGPTVSMSDLHGIIIDSNNDVWAVDLWGNQVVKYSGGDGHMIKPVAVGNSPYTYGNPPPPTCNSSPTPAPCAPVTDKDIHCEPGGGYSYTFSVTNNSGKDVSQMLLTPAQGSSFSLSQQLYNLSPPLADGQSTAITVKIKNVKPGTKPCFFLNFTGKDHPCCIVKVCPSLPDCGGGKTPTPTPSRRR